MLSGTVSDYDAAQPSMQTVLAREADTSTDAVYLTLNAGSVIVEIGVLRSEGAKVGGGTE